MSAASRIPLTSTSPNIDRIAGLASLFPEAFIEGKVDFERLKQALGESIQTDRERYGLNWAGKSDAIHALQSLSVGTLQPQREESVNFDTTENLIIEGDNLEVLKLLQKSYFGKVKMIYIDPPYNTGNEFIYPDNFREGLEDYLKYTGQVSGEGTATTSNRETDGRYHSKWLSMMYPRLFLAKNLLREDGFIAVSIGEEEVASLRLLMNEIFGEENHRNTINVRRYDKNLSRQFMERGLFSLSVGFEYVLIYSRQPDSGMNPIFREASQERQTTGYWKGFWNSPNRPTMRYSLFEYTPEKGQWKWKAEVAREAVKNFEEYERDYSNNLTLEEYWEKTGKVKKFIRKNPSGKSINQGIEHWIPPSTGILRTSNWTDQLASESLSSFGLPFDNPKHTELIKKLLRLLSDEDDIVVDFFAGSGTTAQAILQLNEEDGGNRRFILVQLPEATHNKEFPTIVHILRKRVKIAAEKISATKTRRLALIDNERQDRGFKAFRLTASNFKIWDGIVGETDAEAVTRQLELFADNILPGAVPENILFEIILKAGSDLNTSRETVMLAGQTVYKIDDGAILICLEPSITRETLHGMACLKPKSVICLDASFHNDDALLTNAELEMQQQGIQFSTV